MRELSRRHCLLAAGAAGAALLTQPARALTTGTETAPPSTDDWGLGPPGWAWRCRGGRAGRVVRVTTLAAEGAGSLRAAVEASGPRIVVFEVGGVIDLGGRQLTIRHPQLTLAGQTAPAPGITLIKGEVIIATHDVIVQHLGFRPGEYGRPKRRGGDHDGISTSTGARDVIVDHCSFSWATDENLSASGERFLGDGPEEWRRNTSHRITFSHNLIYQCLSHSVHEKGEHSKGSLIHDNCSGILVYRNVYASNLQRNPLFKGGARGAVLNNWIFNPGDRAVHYGLIAKEWQGHPHQTGRLALVGNLLQHGPDTEPGTALFTLGGQGDVALHQRGNLAFDRLGRAAPLTANASGGQARLLPDREPYLPTDGAGRPARDLALRPAQALPQWLPGTVGARPWDRDPLDARLLADLARGEGRIIDSELESPLGGHPRHVPTQQAFDEQAWRLEDMRPRAGWSSLRG